jgi:hypothetical protein
LIFNSQKDNSGFSEKNPKNFFLLFDTFLESKGFYRKIKNPSVEEGSILFVTPSETNLSEGYSTNEITNHSHTKIIY